MKDPLSEQTVSSRQEAEKLSVLLGSTGSHQVPSGWRPLPSEEALKYLIRYGIAAYRVRYEQKGLLGRLGGEARSGSRKLRRVQIDPLTEDADGDGIVQEGTTAERPAKIIPKLSGLSKSRVKIPKHNLSEADSLIKELGGIGRPRLQSEGPISFAVVRKAEIKHEVSQKFGELNTLADYHDALSKAFPNAKIELTSLHGDITEIETVNPHFGRPSAKLEADLLKLTGLKKDDELNATKAFMDGLLFKSITDPDTANLVGRVGLLKPGVDAVGIAGSDLSLPIAFPVGVWISPSEVHNSTLPMSDKEVLDLANRLITELQDKPGMLGKTDAVGAARMVADSDQYIAAQFVAFHEWAHMSNMALAKKALDGKVFDEAQKWITSGGTPPKGLPELTAKSALIEGASTAFFEGLRDPEIVKEAQRLFKELGYPTVDISNPEEVRSVYRAMAVRSVHAQKVMSAFLNDDMTDEEWSMFNSVSGYANHSKEEAVAELLGLYDSSPHTANGIYGKALHYQAVAKRMTSK